MVLSWSPSSPNSASLMKCSAMSAFVLSCDTGRRGGHISVGRSNHLMGARHPQSWIHLLRETRLTIWTVRVVSGRAITNCTPAVPGVHRSSSIHATAKHDTGGEENVNEHRCLYIYVGIYVDIYDFCDAFPRYIGEASSLNTAGTHLRHTQEDEAW